MKIKKYIPQKVKNVAHVVTRRKKRRDKLKFGIDLVKHCNLKCKGCDHFSCIAKEEFAVFENVERDLHRIKEIFGDRVDQINLLGGEPLLNEQISMYCELVRKLFPKTTIIIITNGTLLLKQDTAFWDCCRENNIIIKPTKYPIEFDYEKAKQLAEKYGVKYDYQAHTDQEIKEMYCVPIDLEGKQNPGLSYSMCAKGNGCISLENGKLYTCTLVPNIRIFNDYFGKNIAVTEDDYVDIYSCNDPDEILDRLSEPIPFCKYCNNLNYRAGITWGVTEGNINEWV